MKSETIEFVCWGQPCVAQTTRGTPVVVRASQASEAAKIFSRMDTKSPIIMVRSPEGDVPHPRSWIR